MSTPAPAPSPSISLDWKDRISVMNLTLFLVIIVGLLGLVFVLFFKADVLQDPSTSALIDFFKTLILLAFGVLTGKEVAAIAYKAGTKHS